MIYICFMTPEGFIDEAGFASNDVLNQFVINHSDFKFTQPHYVPILINSDFD